VQRLVVKSICVLDVWKPIVLVATVDVQHVEKSDRGGKGFDARDLRG
jgi:hypothetical protein